MSKCIWIITGEASGEIYGARIYSELKKQNPDLHIKAMGCRELKDAGAEIIQDSSEMAVMGFVEVIKRYPMFKRIFNQMVQRAADERPDAVVLIDYPGYNLRLAKKLNALGIKTIYYISPQVWAWHKSRIPVIKQVVDRLIVIFPFEVDFWKKHDFQADFLGHPLIELLGEEQIHEERDPNKFVLLPGSRKSELSTLLKPMIDSALQISIKYPELKFVIPAAREYLIPMIEEAVKDVPDPSKFIIENGRSVYWMQKAIAGLASSGTVTIQAAILGLPLISIYKVHPFTYFLAKRLVDLDYFTMVNIIAEKEIYREYLQNDVHPDILVPQIEQILPGGERQQEVISDLEEMVKKLGKGTNIFAETAKLISESANLP
ncbi:lipid-A-disaccharide synthase [Lentisphaera profundi]|uniref:Lipid-A-disaccharide synthase n=1 Tax=Lentisphaera profundi TaxID=1658616 RepID=A0ABY7VYJ7_9BACT|nr:lipid-A-disaccharide synthase [Lentisphaera profundi]WDE98348.1 lipid-A-disaccharide synthase [Lentisphaera profundi]